MNKFLRCTYRQILLDAMDTIVDLINGSDAWEESTTTA